ncbi:short chain dehydrogenase, putative [Bodo saltans]|uniref:Short chain dehydrogenase, putative n=1 Tax=Bodo saltans TaxID=75058 RepID=A0A0S4JTE1_BODSA|nr:short chain dehydrogenase, putative [Bodo saltans]|eukprot:CUG93257.1 short chain dehydrogenase, putative [Bodo saltans]
MKVALITGGAQGVGRGIALHLLRLREPTYNVVVVDRDQAGIDDFLAIVNREGIAATKVAAQLRDVSKQASAQETIKEIRNQFGRLDLLVNNAGGGGLGTALEDVTEEQWNNVLNSNLSSTFFFSQAAAPLLTSAKGSIVNISSTRAVMSEPNSFPYSAAKGGVEGLTHSLACSLAGKVNVNCLRLGWIDVSGEEFGPGRIQQLLSEKDHSQHFSGRVGTASNVAEAVVFLSNAQFVCGEVLTIDGGMTRKMIYSE